MSVDDLIRRARTAAAEEPNRDRLALVTLELCNELSNMLVKALKMEASIHRLTKDRE